MAHGMDDSIIESDCKEIASAPAAPETVSLQCQAGEVKAVRGGNSRASLFCNFSRRVNHDLPLRNITRVQPWRVSIPAKDAAFSNFSFSAPGLKMMRLGLALRMP
jgi:hypothetical protein